MYINGLELYREALSFIFIIVEDKKKKFGRTKS